jgi:hypothetical protein
MRRFLRNGATTGTCAATLQVNLTTLVVRPTSLARRRRRSAALADNFAARNSPRIGAKSLAPSSASPKLFEPGIVDAFLRNRGEPKVG